MEWKNWPLDKMCEKFTKCFLKITKECILTKIVTIRNNDKPWFNNEIRKEIRVRGQISLLNDREMFLEHWIVTTEASWSLILSGNVKTSANT
jgi:hypothetical protein